MNESSGRVRFQPVAIAAAACDADRVLPKESGATRTRIGGRFIRPGPKAPALSEARELFITGQTRANVPLWARKGGSRAVDPPLRRSNLTVVKLLGRKKVSQDNAGTGAVNDDYGAVAPTRGTQTTAGKGRPTPKRSESAKGRKGPTVPAPLTAAEARARRKALAGRKLSRDERKAERQNNRSQMAERRERMMAGEEAYLLPRDQGPIRRYIRDVVDSRRNVMGMFMPTAILMLFVSIGVPQLQYYVSPLMLVLIALMIVDGVILGRKVTKLVNQKFPSNTESRLKLGMYAATRASQMRRLRAPKPQVERGSNVS